MEHVALHRHRHGLIELRADRPPANAMDLTLLAELLEAIELFRREKPRAVVLAGRPGYFSAGVDLKAAPGYDAEQQRAMVANINAMALGVYELPFPVVGAITGHAIAGGLVLALCTDIRIVSSAGRYGLTEVKVGVPYPQAAIGVAEGVRLGVFDEVAEPDAVVGRALEVAGGLASFPPEAYARAKRELRGATATRLRAAAAEDPLLGGWVR
jgi:enoyl-CoA hydratase